MRRCCNSLTDYHLASTHAPAQAGQLTYEAGATCAELFKGWPGFAELLEHDGGAADGWRPITFNFSVNLTNSPHFDMMDGWACWAIWVMMNAADDCDDEIVAWWLL